MSENGNGALKIEQVETDRFFNLMQVSGFTEEDMENLNSLDRNAMEAAALEMIDRRNGGIGSCWKRGYGVYGFFPHPRMKGTLMFRIGNSCD